MSGAAWLALGAIAVAFGRFVPLPGIDYESFQTLLGQQGDFWDLSVGPIGNTINALVMTYFFVGNSKRTWAWRAGLAFYLFCAMAQGLGMAFWLESLDGTHGGLSSIYVVEYPGWSFRVTTMLAYAAGGSILWFLSKSIDATQRATGALFLLAVRVFIDQWGLISSLGDGLARGELVWTSVLPWLAMPIAAIAIAVAVYRRPNAEWPATLWRWNLQSHIDVIALIAVATLPGSIASLVGVDARWVDAFDALLALGIGASGIAWWWKMASSQPKSRRPTKTLGVVGAMALVLLMGGVFGFWRGGGVERFTTPLPLEGDASFTITLDADTEFEADDGETMVALLETLGASAELTSMNDQSITLEVSDAIDRDSVLQALTPVRFLLSPVLDIVDNARAEVLQLGRPSSYGTRHLIGECSVFDELSGTYSRRGGASGLLARGCRLAVQRDEVMENECRLYCISPDAVLASGDVQDAFVTVPEYDPMPVVSIVLSDAAANLFGSFTADHIEQSIAIELNGELMSTPVIQSRIDGGRLQITLPRGGDYNTSLQEAEQLAAGLRPKGVRTLWHLRDE